MAKMAKEEGGLTPEKAKQAMSAYATMQTKK
jgi:hypothetical protein